VYVLIEIPVMTNAGICCLLLVVCCLLSVVFCLLSGVWCLLSVVCCSLYVVWCLLCVSRGRQVYTNVDEAFHIERASRSLAKTSLFYVFSGPGMVKKR
jgi:Ca2+/Na+ antiporter